MEFRATLSFPIVGAPPSEAATDTAIDQLLAVAPDSGAVITITADTLDVTMTFDALDASHAIKLASGFVGTVIGGGAICARAVPA